jgi:hypothetical protein
MPLEKYQSRRITLSLGRLAVEIKQKPFIIRRAAIVVLRFINYSCDAEKSGFFWTVELPGPVMGGGFWVN